MVTVVFHFTDWHDYPGGDLPKSVMSTWVHDVRAFGADKIIMIDQTSFKIGQYYQHNDEQILFERFNSLEDCMDFYNDKIWIFIELDEKSIFLNEFEHPIDDCFYVVGPDYKGIMTNKEPSYWVKIPMIHYRPLYAHVAMMTVLYDRMIRLNN